MGGRGDQKEVGSEAHEVPCTILDLYIADIAY